MSTGHRPRHSHAAPRRRHARTATGAGRRIAVLAAAVPIGLLVCCGLVWQSSSAAFLATTDNPANAWTTGVVGLTTNRTGAALFTTKGTPGAPVDSQEDYLVPGSSGYRCITVTYTGNVPTADTGVRLYGKFTGDAALAAALQVTVQVSTPGLTPTPGADCAGFVAAPGSATSSFSAFPADYGAGLRDLNNDNAPDWRPSPKTPGDLSRTYKISYGLPAVAYGAEYQGKAVQMAFTWEVQSDDTPAT